MAKKKSLPKDGDFEIKQLEKSIKLNRKHKLTEKQKRLLNIILDKESKIILINGPAGTSKTYIALYAALQELLDNPDKTLIYLRSIVENTRRTIGLLPGSIEEKFSPYTLPLSDKMEEFLSVQDINYLLDSRIVQAMPINYLRGASWNNKIIILDEAQNVSTDEFITILTRIGENSKMIICGDLMQSDIRYSGFKNICETFSCEDSKNMGIHQFSFDSSDIVRSAIVRFIVSKLEAA